MDFKAGTVGTIYKNYFRPEYDAIHFKDTTWTYADLDDKVRAFANFLKEKGVSKGDKVILVECQTNFRFWWCGVFWTY